jgi:hypothetical protein
VRLPSDLAADLVLLTDALDAPTTDIAATLSALMSAAATAVPSYVGMSVRVCTRHSHVELTTLESSQIAGITTSLRVPLQTEPASPHLDSARFVLILYASKAGALVDLAADLAWLTGSSMDEVRLDDDLAGAIHLHQAESLRSQSTINQAVGVLIGRGRTPDQAQAELDGRAADTRTHRYEAAVGLLASLSTGPLADE